MKLIISTAFGLILTLLFFGNSNITFAQCGNGPSCTGNFVCVNSDGGPRCLQNQVSSNGLCQGDASVRCSASQACIQNNATEIVCAPLAGSSANPSLPTSPDATTCSPTCQPGETCIKSAAGPLVCRPTATNCATPCTAGKVCVRATPTATTGTCVDSAPTSAAGGDTGGAGSGGTGGGTLLDGLNAFGGAGSGLNTTGTLIGFIANIIRWILGLLGMVFFVIVVLQGYLYMVSSGDAGKTAAATGAITNAVIGLIIIMGAFLITNYVTSALTSGVSSGTSNITNSSGSTNGASGSSPTQPSNTRLPGTVLPSPSSNN